LSLGYARVATALFTLFYLIAGWSVYRSHLVMQGVWW
jgi:hypothetical protein